ncbi:MAG: malonyl CoA-acyl carrier protein transacylase, partial [Actinomycetota bacterium]|nr:malonyl CoA-acyl carrier protein transacylase [Actinomycetota bacterium]
AGELEDLCAEARRGGSEVWVANMNAPGQVVVSGTSVGVAAVAALASPLGFKLVPLPVGGGFHSPLMEDALPALRQALSAVTFADHHVPVVANVDGLPHRDGRRWPELAARQLTSPVLWERSVRWLAGRVPGPLVELGPGRTLAGMVRRISPTTEVTSVSSPADAASLAGSLTGRAGGKVPRGRETQRCPTV